VNHLLRSLAPISDAGWDLLDQEARERLTPALGARRLIDFSGPGGWQHSATNLGRTAPLTVGDGGPVTALQRRVLPLIELRADFTLSRAELRDGDRGADDVDLTPLDNAAHQIAVAEGTAVFHGWGDAFTGVIEASPHKALSISSPEQYADRVAGAIELLLGVGVAGPYALAAGNDEYRVLNGASEHGGYPLREHVAKILDGPVVWVPGLEGAVVLSTRGGDFVFDCGQDLSIGYDSHDADDVRLYLEESFSFHVATPEASVALASAGVVRQ
jgi:uncharacterized linocin/CFP29 family protein